MARQAVRTDDEALIATHEFWFSRLRTASSTANTYRLQLSTFNGSISLGDEFQVATGGDRMAAISLLSTIHAVVLGRLLDERVLPLVIAPDGVSQSWAFAVIDCNPGGKLAEIAGSAAGALGLHREKGGFDAGGMRDRLRQNQLDTALLHHCCSVLSSGDGPADDERTLQQ